MSIMKAVPTLPGQIHRLSGRVVLLYRPYRPSESPITITHLLSVCLGIPSLSLPPSLPPPPLPPSPPPLFKETALFRHRLEELSPAEMSKFIPEHGLFFEVVTSERKAALRSKLLSIPAAPMMEFDRTTYYRIPFWQASDLIGKRQVRFARVRFGLCVLRCVVSFVWLEASFTD